MIFLFRDIFTYSKCLTAIKISSTYVVSVTIYLRCLKTYIISLQRHLNSPVFGLFFISCHKPSTNSKGVVVIPMISSDLVAAEALLRGDSRRLKDIV